MIVVTAHFEAKAGCRGQVAEIARPCVEATRREAGCISYELFASTEDDRGLIFVEQWESLEALRAHQQSEHIARWKTDREPYVEGPSRVSIFQAEASSL